MDLTRLIPRREIMRRTADLNQSKARLAALKVESEAQLKELEERVAELKKEFYERRG